MVRSGLKVQDFVCDRTWMTGSKPEAASGAVRSGKRNGDWRRLTANREAMGLSVVFVNTMIRRSGV
jgi:hypothetical protein